MSGSNVSPDSCTPQNFATLANDTLHDTQIHEITTVGHAWHTR